MPGRHRTEKLRLDCISGSDDKLANVQAWAADAGVVAERIADIVNDVNDQACLEWVCWPIVVADAHPDVLALARCTTALRSGPARSER